MGNLTVLGEQIRMIDLLIFTGLEALGVLAIVGNLALITVLLRNKYLCRASFILMLNLAIADVLHGIVTTCYFYPPIVLKTTHVGELIIRLFNIVDWTAWAITLTHMSAICLDRLIAIMLYGRYNIIVTISRIRNYSLSCWMLFLATNIVFYFADFCCMIRPLQAQNYYSFGYIETNMLNLYVVTYTPLEIATICILSISNPITLVQLYRRHKRKIALKQQGTQKSSSESSSSLLKQQRSQWHSGYQTLAHLPVSVRSLKILPRARRASTMLLEMSMKMGSKHMATTDVREIAAKRANRQQQRILLQISVVALIFYAYMTAYYISYYSRYFQSTAAMVFNSFFYSTTHMINPVIYFSLNKEMRAQLWCAFSDLLGFIGCKKKDPYGFANTSTKINQSTKGLTMNKTKVSGASCSETSPLFSSAHHYKSTCETAMSQEGDEAQSSSAGAESAEIQAIVNNASYESEEYQSLHDEIEKNKMTSCERSAFLNQLLKVLQYTSSHSVQSGSLAVDLHLRASRPHNALLPKAVKGKFMRMSTTMQMIAKEPLDKFDQDIRLKKKFLSMTTLDCQPLLSDERELEEETPVDSPSRSRSSSLLSSLNGEHQKSELLPSDSLAFLLSHTEEEYDDEDIAYL